MLEFTHFIVLRSDQTDIIAFYWCCSWVSFSKNGNQKETTKKHWTGLLSDYFYFQPYINIKLCLCYFLRAKITWNYVKCDINRVLMWVSCFGLASILHVMLIDFIFMYLWMQPAWISFYWNIWNSNHHWKNNNYSVRTNVCCCLDKFFFVFVRKSNETYDCY